MMEMDIGHSSQSSQGYSYTVDGGIPDAQFDEAMNSFLDDALEDDLQVDEHATPPKRTEDNAINNEEDSEYFDDDEDAESKSDNGSAGLPAQSDVSDDGAADDDPDNVPQPGTSSMMKRQQGDLKVERPFKRKCTELSFGYLDALNRDIRDAALRGCIEDKDLDEDGVTAYRTSQLGLTIWSPVEKRILYEVTSRLGRNAVPDISQAIGSKSIIEVEDYLSFLHYASEERKSKLRQILQPAERPAAIELSPQCCHALDEAADTVSLMQERKEQRREEQKWGPAWRFTPSMFEEATDEDGGQLLDERTSELGALFDIPKWLGLSSDIFMNSAVPSNNWNFVDEEPPTIWTTAMEDFHSLTISITRRLVQTALFIAMSRLRTKREAEPRILGVVRREDVEAALESLDMEDKRHDFWRGCARRLRLNVKDNESRVPRNRRRDGQAGMEYMTFDEVEAALGDENDEPRVLDVLQVDEIRDHPAEDYESIAEDGVTDNEAESGSLGPPKPIVQYTTEELAVRNEAEEVMLFSGVDFPQSTRSKEVLMNRISSERRQEEYANRCDEQASREGEVKMWELLEKPVPPVLRVKETQEQLPRSNLGVDGVYSVGRNWRRALHYSAEWETLDGLEGEEEK